MSTKIDIQGPLFIRVANDDGVLLERSIGRGETLYIDTEPEEPAHNVITMNMADTVAVTQG